MHQIRDWLFISSYALASNTEYIQKEDFDAMLQLYRPIDIPGVQSQFLEMTDGKPISTADIEAGINFVRDHHAAQEKVLVTCGAGISRSVTMTIAALKAIEGGDLEHTYRDVRKRHPDAMPDQVHWDSIATYFGEKVPFWDMWARIMLES